MGREEAYTGFWWELLSERDHLENPGVEREGKIKMGLQEVGWAWTG
jgi:hypothetical protein